MSLEKLNKGHCGWSCRQMLRVGGLKGDGRTSQTAIWGAMERSLGFILLNESLEGGFGVKSHEI